jgi:AAA+ superfamily predicted ATPase
MNLEVVVKKSLLASEMKIAKDQFSHLLNIEKEAVHSRYNKQAITEANIDALIEKTTLLFAGVYASLKKTIEKETPQLRKEPVEFTRAYFAYCASEAVLQYLPKEFSGDSFGEHSEHRKPNTSSDAALITSTIRDLAKALSITEHLGQSYGAILTHFQRFKEKAREQIQEQKYQKAYSLVQRVNITNELFTIKGIDKYKGTTLTKKLNAKTSTTEQEDFKQKPKIITLDKQIHAEDILGNNEAKKSIAESVFQLFAADPERGNPFQEDGGFQNIYLLAGDSGTGKTMLAHYAITQAQILSEKYNIPFQAVEIAFDSSLQDGPVQVARYQFSWIVEKKIPTLVIIDEAEDKVHDRGKLFNATHKIATTNEFLRFTDGLTYGLGGNRISFFMTNRPYDVDRALRDRASGGTYHCQGPTTPEEKMIVLRNNIEKNIDQKFVEVDQWESFGELCYTLDLKGRQLREVAKSIIKSSRTNDYPTNFMNMNYEDKRKEIQKRYKPITNEVIEQHIYTIANKKSEVKEASQAFNN